MLKEATTEYEQLEAVINEKNNRFDEIYQYLDEKVCLIFIYSVLNNIYVYCPAKKDCFILKKKKN
jgi:hypothetical protein